MMVTYSNILTIVYELGMQTAFLDSLNIESDDFSKLIFQNKHFLIHGNSKEIRF